MTQQDLMIEIKDMNKWYGEFHVLKNINLSVKRRKNRDMWSLRVRKIYNDSVYQST